MKKKFIITIDTEGDNLWAWDGVSPIATRNTEYLPRFQRLCDLYGFKPVWLTNYEMILDASFAEFAAKVDEEGRGELGMHLHAWNMPPEYPIKNRLGGKPYLIEYPFEIMEEKIALMTKLIKEKTGVLPVSHRAGRWMVNDQYVNLLSKYGYRIDCSVTPHEDWSVQSGATIPGIDYSHHAEVPYFLDPEKTVLEVPMTIRRSHSYYAPGNRSLRRFCGSLKRLAFGQNIWVRPGQNTEEQIHDLIDRVFREEHTDYCMFMLHSSEFMPGGSLRFKTAEDIEELYRVIERIFRHLEKSGFEGITLKEYASMRIENERVY